MQSTIQIKSNKNNFTCIQRADLYLHVECKERLNMTKTEFSI